MIFPTLAILLTGLTFSSSYMDFNTSVVSDNIGYLYGEASINSGSQVFYDINYSLTQDNNTVSGTLLSFFAYTSQELQNDLIFGYSYENGSYNFSVQFLVDIYNNDDEIVWSKDFGYNYHTLSIDRDTYSYNFQVIEPYYDDYNVSDFSYFRFKMYFYLVDETFYREHFVQDIDEFKEGYDWGYEQGYIRGYDEGGIYGYDNGLREGLETGFTNGYNEAMSTHQFTFTNLFASIADTPILMFRRLFNFDLFGVNLIGVFLSLFTALIVIDLVKRFFK